MQLQKFLNFEENGYDVPNLGAGPREEGSAQHFYESKRFCPNFGAASCYWFLFIHPTPNMLFDSSFLVEPPWLKMDETFAHVVQCRRNGGTAAGRRGRAEACEGDANGGGRRY
jgi:hypothetical protein